MFVHAAIVFAGIVAVGKVHALALQAVIGLVVGHSVAVLAFYSHDLSHNTVLRRGPLRSVLEVFFWMLTSTRATVWHKIHNTIHHRNTNTMNDSIRYYAESERSLKRSIYTGLFIPTKYNWFNPLVLLQPVATHMMHSRAAILHPDDKGDLITNLGVYRPADRVRVALEVVLVVGWHVAIFYMCGGTWKNYLWAGVVPSLFGIMVASTYVYSQHSLHPLSPHDNPFGTTTLRLPRIVNALHSNMAHHTAHHLFEGMRADYLPRVTELLRRYYPDALDERGPIECWRSIFKNGMYKPDPIVAPPSPIDRTVA